MTGFTLDRYSIGVTALEGQAVPRVQARFPDPNLLDTLRLVRVEIPSAPAARVFRAIWRSMEECDIPVVDQVPLTLPIQHGWLHAGGYRGHVLGEGSIRLYERPPVGGPKFRSVAALATVEADRDVAVQPSTTYETPIRLTVAWQGGSVESQIFESKVGAWREITDADWDSPVGDLAEPLAAAFRRRLGQGDPLPSA